MYNFSSSFLWPPGHQSESSPLRFGLGGGGFSREAISDTYYRCLCVHLLRFRYSSYRLRAAVEEIFEKWNGYRTHLGCHFDNRLHASHSRRTGTSYIHERTRTTLMPFGWHFLFLLLLLLLLLLFSLCWLWVWPNPLWLFIISCMSTRTITASLSSLGAVGCAFGLLPSCSSWPSPMPPILSRSSLVLVEKSSDSSSPSYFCSRPSRGWWKSSPNIRR